MKNILELEKVGVSSPVERIREARIRIMDIEKRVNVVIFEINDKKSKLQYDTSLDDNEREEIQKDIKRTQVHLEALLRDL